MMIWGDYVEMKVLDNQNKICSAMYDPEKNDIKTLSIDQKKEIAETTQLQIEDVHDLVSKFKQMESFHKWIKGKHTKGEPLPESRDELMQMYRYERPSFLMASQKRAPSRVESRFMARRHRT